MPKQTKSTNVAALLNREILWYLYSIVFHTVVVAKKYTAQQNFIMDFIFVLILVRIRNDFFEVINKYGNP